ncbi:farnesol dehydrogenase-like [Ischnura elegans]|uniref:farnesol dehydrogenase-like n=1 Tax=Ischnura elegans TaxID=197161 RepID=UPI001ED87C86|nr:farnesol dehydrogenase-like [Ischnura elegans]
MERWCGRVAVVTGASAGIGASIAESLVRHGMVVVAMARREQRLKELAEKLQGGGGGPKGSLHPLKVDICNEAEVRDAFQWVKDTYGAVHVLVNNAGITRNVKLSEMERTDVMRALVETNVIALSLCTGLAVRMMRESGVEDGHIIHINSVAGHSILPFTGHHSYGSTKHAVTVLTEGLRKELMEAKSKIRVTSVSPGLVKTEIFEAAGSQEDLYKENPYLNPQDVADCVVFALGMPSHVQIHEVTVKPVGEFI